MRAAVANGYCVLVIVWTPGIRAQTLHPAAHDEESSSLQAPDSDGFDVSSGVRDQNPTLCLSIISGICHFYQSLG
jgi:hypothetical protein